MTFSMVELIGTKRDGGVLSPDALHWIITEFTADRIPDYQLSALLMAILLNGMTQDELGPWTDAMLHSGDVLDLSRVSKPKIDKHSTGGVGDKISIPLAPIVAACGVAVPMMSGRGLGHTGGTLDKLESIPGFSTQIDAEDFDKQLEEIGVVMVGQTERLVPADRRIYALRDASGTVPSIPLISSSIMSKKLAEDLDGLLLDVKVGSGAFMKTIKDATELAQTMVGIGVSNGVPVTAILTNMDQPLGQMVGNANEIIESIDVLKGEGPADVTALTTRFAAEMLVLSGTYSDDRALEKVRKVIDSGDAYELFLKLVERQGGDPASIENTKLLPRAPHTATITADRSGYIGRCDAYEVGLASVRLGAGRARKEDEVDPGVGLEISVKVGDEVNAGDTLAIMTYRDEARRASAQSVLGTTFVITDEPVARSELIMGEVR
jgi:pyrimidine-nucleoside phosphorylase